MHFLPRANSNRHRIEFRAQFLELSRAVCQALFLLDSEPRAMVSDQFRCGGVPITESQGPVR